MSCNHHFVEQHLFDYLEDKLSPEARELLLQNIEQCTHCRDLVEDAAHAKQLFASWQDEAVPDWNRNAYMSKNQAVPGRLLNWISLAVSCTAILMVIFNVQLISNESGLHISFAGAPEQQQVKSIVQSETAKLEQAFNKKLQLALNAQQASTRLMLADWLEKTRQERRDDLNFLITGIQTQRLEDQQELESRLSLIAENQLQNSQFINQFIQSAATAQESSHE